MPDDPPPQQPEATPKGQPDPRVAELESALERERNERDLLAQAAKAGMHDPLDALHLIAGDADGEASLAKLRETKPYLFRQTQTPGIAAPNAAQTTRADQLRAKAMTSGLTRDIQNWREARKR